MEFFKVSGAGNDFLALAEPPETPSTASILAWCRRGVSLGGDGLFVLRRQASVEGSRVRMDYFNSDGLPADLCLNGTRCAAQLAFHLGWAATDLRIETGAGAVDARRVDASRVSLALPAPGEFPEEPRELTLEVDGIGYAGVSTRVGVPHFVLPWPESLDRVPLDALGRALRFHAGLGEEGANVNFVRYPAADRMEIRTYERGVEGETLSCGSGIVAGAAAGRFLGRTGLPVRVLTQGGFELEVGVLPDGRWALSGDARVVARGDLLPEASSNPAPPPWLRS